MIENSLLEILRCPVTGGRLTERDGALVSDAVDGVVRSYPITDGVPVLVPTAAVESRPGA